MCCLQALGNPAPTSSENVKLPDMSTSKVGCCSHAGFPYSVGSSIPVLREALHQVAHVAHVHGIAGASAAVAGRLVLGPEFLRQGRQSRAHSANMLMPQLNLHGCPRPFIYSRASELYGQPELSSFKIRCPNFAVAAI